MSLSEPQGGRRPRGLIEDGCDEAEAGTRTVRLINPKRSMELLRQSQTES